MKAIVMVNEGYFIVLERAIFEVKEGHTSK
jgi:hypothetical protein